MLRWSLRRVRETRSGRRQPRSTCVMGGVVCCGKVSSAIDYGGFRRGAQQSDFIQEPVKQGARYGNQVRKPVLRFKSGCRSRGGRQPQTMAKAE
jgi:hypothetical protein